jgi:hypothetical protein
MMTECRFGSVITVEIKGGLAGADGRRAIVASQTVIHGLSDASP